MSIEFFAILLLGAIIGMILSMIGFGFLLAANSRQKKPATRWEPTPPATETISSEDIARAVVARQQYSDWGLNTAQIGAVESIGDTTRVPRIRAAQRPTKPLRKP